MMTRASGTLAVGLLALALGGGRQRTRQGAIRAGTGGQSAGRPQGQEGRPYRPLRRAGGPDINGTWTGELTQIGTSTPYKFEIAFTPKGMETKYPDLNCAGKLTRVGQSKSYAFFVEVITQGISTRAAAARTARITVARSADKLAVGLVRQREGKHHRGVRHAVEEVAPAARRGSGRPQHQAGRLHLGEAEGAALERERIAAPEVHVPVFVDMRGAPRRRPHRAGRRAPRARSAPSR